MSIKLGVKQRIMGLIMNKCHALWFILLELSRQLPRHNSGASHQGHWRLASIRSSEAMHTESSDWMTIPGRSCLDQSLLFVLWNEWGLFRLYQTGLVQSLTPVAVPKEQRVAVGMRPGCRTRGWSCNHTDNFTPLPLHGSWIEPLNPSVDWTKIDNEEWEEQGEKKRERENNRHDADNR